MKEYLNEISLYKNRRGCFDLDPFKGCSLGIKENPKGCYGICYAAKIAKSRGYDFSKSVKRYLPNDFSDIAKKLFRIKTDIYFDFHPVTNFVRLGVSCDPSEDWEHTIDIVNMIKLYIENIVIVTKHWTEITKKQMKELKGVYLNTSISALDTKEQIKKRLYYYNEFKKYGKSILRVNTAFFNDLYLHRIQKKLLNNENVIDNILRFNKSHDFVKDGLINVEKKYFLDNFAYASVENDNTYFGSCELCPDQCGVNDNKELLIKDIQ